MTALVRKHPDYFPLYTTRAAGSVDGEAWTNWCEGFLGGQMWLLSERTGRRRTGASGRALLAAHRGAQVRPDVHDLGFLFWSTWRRWYELTGDEALDETVVVRPGSTMALRFNEKGRYLRSFLAADSLFIDIMMNVGIIFYAAQQTGDEDLLADRDASTASPPARILVRGDGSASHEGIFDLDTGEFLRQSTQQGCRDDASWARGLAWALYGFGTAYRYTGDRRFLRTAQDCADFYIERTGAALVPPNDWEEPNPVHPFESSAAAIAAGGIWQLAGLVEDETRARGYANYALRILTRLCEPDFLSYEDPAWEGVLHTAAITKVKALA